MSWSRREERRVWGCWEFNVGINALQYALPPCSLLTDAWDHCKRNEFLQSPIRPTRWSVLDPAHSYFVSLTGRTHVLLTRRHQCGCFTKESQQTSIDMEVSDGCRLVDALTLVPSDWTEGISAARRTKTET
jgi:hypothetical protein